MGNTLLRVSDLKKSFRKSLIFDNVSFEVNEKEILGIVGLSGSGKTTLLNMIAGFEVPDAGKIQFQDIYGKKELKSIYKFRGKNKLLFGYSSQEPSFYPELSVQDNLFYFGVLSGFTRDDVLKRMDGLLRTLNLEEFHEMIAGNLSEGMKKRLDLACALITEPKILLLDEPTANLDYYLRDDLLSIIKKVNRMGVTVIFVSHYLEEIEQICSKAFVIKDHGIIEIGTKNLRENFMKVFKK
ncbi:MAG: ABC transporter ATP-binding protein [Nanoarchaeota archaeon]